MTASYYNGWRDRLLHDYQTRNPRVIAALDFAKAHLADGGTLLDIGCGIGWTTAELAEGREAIGVDISPVLIETAREMFGDKCQFRAGDIAAIQLSGQFDAVVMIDVYEHIPHAGRRAVHQQLTRLLRGRLVMTVPTPEALQWARDNGIELQPVDEDVTDADIELLAEQIGGTVLVNKLVTVWRPNDYRHVLIVNG